VIQRSPASLVRCTRPQIQKAVFLFAVLALVCGGCKRAQQKRLRAEEIHRITHEFVVAVNAVAPPGAEVHGEVGAFDRVPNSTDHVEIRIFAKREGKAYPPSVAEILQALNRVATARGLIQDPQSENPDAIILNYRRAGVITHTIHVHFYGTSESSEAIPAPLQKKNQAPRLAIILDDLGNDRAAANAVFKMPYPLTISVLPNQAHSVEIAQEARSRGYEVMLHLPMESVGKERAEARELRPGMKAREVSNLVNAFLKEIPGVRGVNNHQGSRSTADTKLMSELMPVLREHQLFYVDSRTSAATVAYDTAQRFGVRAGFRNVPFLDDVEEVSAVRKQIEHAIAGATRKEEAIAIGHAHRTTLEALRETLPEAKSQGVRLVFASELVR